MLALRNYAESCTGQKWLQMWQSEWAWQSTGPKAVYGLALFSTLLTSNAMRNYSHSVTSASAHCAPLFIWAEKMRDEKYLIKNKLHYFTLDSDDNPYSTGCKCNYLRRSDIRTPKRGMKKNLLQLYDYLGAFLFICVCSLCLCVYVCLCMHACASRTL